MKLKPFKRIPVLIAASVITAVCLLRILRLGVFEQLEWKTFDWRARLTTRFPSPVATNLGFVFLSDDSIAALNDGSLGFRYGLYWPRHIYGRLVRELAAQGAKVVAFDILFKELRPDHASVPVKDRSGQAVNEFLALLHPGQTPVVVDGLTYVESDDFFAWQLEQAGNVMLAAERDILPHDLFRTNTLTLGDIAADRDADGVLRRAKTFRMYRRWHPLFLKASSEFGLDLSAARVEGGRIILPRPDGEEINVRIDSNGDFKLADFVGDKLPPGVPPKAKAFWDERVWHMGIVLAAQEMNLDLANAAVNLARGRITLRGPNGLQRVIPVDTEGYFYINWEITPNDLRLTKEAIENLLAQDQMRIAGRDATLTNRWRDKLAVVGSSATGNDLTDRGATPLEEDTLLVSKHWNVANAVLTDRFVNRSSLATELVLIAFWGALTAFLTWQCRALVASFSVAGIAAAYVALGTLLYVEQRYWLPLVLPVLGACLLEHVCLITWRVRFEEKEKRRVRAIFSRVVSPKIVRELLQAERLSLAGARREITVLFADVRGFTEFTDLNRDRAAAYARERQLTGQAAEDVFDRQARETLSTVNAYLALVAGMVTKHDGTLDKYIGDCVMAFWGAPTPNPHHALACVRAAIEAQRALYELNQQRMREKQENAQRAADGRPRLSPLPILMLGAGINTGLATVGLMGSDLHGWNYTVFGREVNLASRLENLSGRGRIFIGEATYAEILRDDPALAASCVALPPVSVKGFRDAVKVYEVRWQPTDPAASADEVQNAAISNGASTTGSARADEH